MKKNEAAQLVSSTFTKAFSEEQFVLFIRNLLPGIEAPSSRTVPNAQIPQGFREHVHSYTRLGTYRDPQGDVLDVVIVKLKRQGSLDRARTRQRNLMAHYLNKRGKDAVLVAYIADDSADWRFSYVKLAYQTEITDKGKVKVKSEFTPARRYSFLVGENEPTHTAQKQLGDLLMQDGRLTLAQIEEAFNIESVTKEFFEDYKALFLQLKENLDKIIVSNQQVKAEFERCDIDTANFAKKLLGQIVFLYFLQKKGWLGVTQDAAWGTGDKKFLHNLFKNKGERNYFDDILEPFFYEALAIERVGDFYPALQCKVPFLNGGLFEPLNGYDWENTQIKQDNQVFEEIFKVFNLYNFTVREDEPLEREVAVDPEMLGKVFENLLEIKDRKSKGAYYTPREIVHYMCQESLINYLDTTLNSETLKVAKEDIESLIREGDISLENDLAKEAGRKSGDYGLPESIREFAKEIDFTLADVKICDPAIGSGAFPVGMMTEIVRARRVLTPYLSNQRNRDAYNFKWHCIENSLYGVDIDAGAVEIAKLRLWLSLVVDEESYDHIRPLPNLDYRIVCGNSLLSIQKDLFNFTLYPDLEKKKIQYFGTTSHLNKEVIRQEIEGLIDQLTDGKKAFDFEVYFSEVISEKKGFDVVIGNPPYVRHERIKELKPALRKLHPDVYQGTADLYVYFYSQGIKILCPGGFLTFISSNKFMRASYGKKLRRLLSQDATPKTVIDFGDLPVFDATTYPCIVSVQKSPLPSDNHVTALTVKTVEQIRQIAAVMAKYAWQMPQQKALTVDGWRLESPEILDLLEKLRISGIPLSKYVQERIFRGVVTGFNKAFIIDSITREQLIAEQPSSEEIIKRYLRGKDIKRWHIDYQDLWIIFSRRGINIKNYTAIYNYLLQFKKRLIPGVKGGRKPGTYKWYEIQDNIAYWKEFEQTKIVWGNLAIRPKFAFADAGYYINAPANIIVSDSKYLLGILNSSVTQFLVYQSAAERAGGFLEFKPIYIAPLAIPPQPKDEKISEVVTRILDETRGIPATDISDVEAELDRMVYALYSLTEEEIKMVEESAKS